MPGPHAYLLTWTTYGAWLHGDARGSVDDAHNTYGREFNQISPVRIEWTRERMSEPAFVLDDNARAVVDRAIRERCAFAGAALHALNVRTNHVHAVVTHPGHPPERIMQSLKSWSTRALKAIPEMSTRTHFWTRHGSTRYLWDDRAVVSACEYVALRQDGRGEGAGRD